MRPFNRRAVLGSFAALSATSSAGVAAAPGEADMSPLSCEFYAATAEANRLRKVSNAAGDAWLQLYQGTEPDAIQITAADRREGIIGCRRYSTYSKGDIDELRRRITYSGTPSDKVGRMKEVVAAYDGWRGNPRLVALEKAHNETSARTDAAFAVVGKISERLAKQPARTRVDLEAKIAAVRFNFALFDDAALKPALEDELGLDGALLGGIVEDALALLATSS